MKHQSGQIVIILLLIIIVSLSIGISIAGRSLTEVSNSSKIESSSRAFFAAEAGLEKALNQTIAAGSTVTTTVDTLDNQSKALVQISSVPAASNGLEYPPISKKDFAQFWFIDPKSSLTTPSYVYDENTFMLYFGNCESNVIPCAASTDKPAVEVRVILQQADGSFSAITPSLYYDSDATRSGSGSGKNGFTPLGISGTSKCADSGIDVQTNANQTSKFYCQVSVNLSAYKTSTSIHLILARLRILYSNGSHKVAIAPITGRSLPPQAKVFTSVGTSGAAQRALKVFKEDQVAPQFLDYAIFSAGDISKSF